MLQAATMHRWSGISSQTQSLHCGTPTLRRNVYFLNHDTVECSVTLLQYYYSDGIEKELKYTLVGVCRDRWGFAGTGVFPGRK